MTEQHSIKLVIAHEPALQQSQNKCFEVSVPLPKSLVFNTGQLSVKITTDDDSEKDKIVDALCQVITCWPDNSLKWVKLTYQYCNQLQLYLNIVKNQPKSTVLPFPDYRDNSESVDSYSYKGGTNTLTLDLANNQLEMLGDANEVIFCLNADDLELINDAGQSVRANFTHINVTHQSNLKNDSDSAVALVVDGQFLDTLIQFKLIIDWLVPFDLLKFDLQIHNTNRASHQGGKWDLGDVGSFNFKSLNIALRTRLDTSKEHNTLTDTHNNKSLNGNNIACEQFSSGGVNWQSPVHVNHDNKVDINKNGYVLSNGVDELNGLRCQPVLTLKSNLAITINRFWQNFPKSIAVEDNIVSLGLFPATHYHYELQGGEKKSHSFCLSLNAASNDLTASQNVNKGKIDWSWIRECDLYPFIEREKNNTKSLQSIINLGIDNQSGFIAKREKLDEYGWRNFGELYADHETSGYDGEDIFVSHYNNQYDPIYGFLRQYLITGNSKWFELADDLATHVTDIDIYHTDLDKKEYNGGLFWHTDHYLQAFTSSHRSYSKHQASDAYQDHAGGGGPGGQHCYTTGLYLHYCLTGNQRSKDAVLTLSNWITHVYEGSNTCLELLLAFKNRHVAGYKNHFTGQYPLDRGIANYVNALLDSFELTQQEDYLTLVQNILSNTMHPNEDLSVRGLQDVENTWFYTVLLQALCRYLQVKESRQELDQHFYYCRDCLLNFADWMLEHEYPYLEKPDILEYPNDTWTAQDLRKSHVLAAASYFFSDKKSEYINKARFFQQYVTDKLTDSDTKTYTRILVLLMQNQGTLEYYQTRKSPLSSVPRKDWPLANYQKTSVYGGLFKVMLKRLLRISPKAELDWLKKRLA